MFEDSTFVGNRPVLRDPEQAHYQLMQQITEEANSDNPDKERIKLLTELARKIEESAKPTFWNLNNPLDLN